MLNGKFEFGKRFGKSPGTINFQSEIPAKKHQPASLFVALLISVVFFSTGEEALSDTPENAEPSDTFSTERTGAWRLAYLERIGLLGNTELQTPLVLGEQVILAQTSAPKVCTIFTTKEARKVSDACLVAYREYKGTPYKIMCGHREAGDKRLADIAQAKWSAYSNACGCSNQCKPGDNRN